MNQFQYWCHFFQLSYIKLNFNIGYLSSPSILSHLPKYLYFPLSSPSSLAHLECEGLHVILQDLRQTEGQHQQHHQLAVHARHHGPEVHAEGANKHER